MNLSRVLAYPLPYFRNDACDRERYVACHPAYSSTVLQSGAGAPPTDLRTLLDKKRVTEADILCHARLGMILLVGELFTVEASLERVHAIDRQLARDMQAAARAGGSRVQVVKAYAEAFAAENVRNATRFSISANAEPRAEPRAGPRAGLVLPGSRTPPPYHFYY
jgi:hypothetical protein